LSVHSVLLVRCANACDAVVRTRVGVCARSPASVEKCLCLLLLLRSLRGDDVIDSVVDVPTRRCAARGDDARRSILDAASSPQVGLEDTNRKKTKTKTNESEVHVALI
jgi:hypothetical protein